MTAKEYLKQYRTLNAKIDAKIAQKCKLIDRLRYASANVSGVHSTQLVDKIGDITAQLIDLGKEIDSEIDQLVNLRREIKSRIAALPDPIHRDILEMRYISCWTVAKVATERNCSVETVYNNQREALKSFTDYYRFSVI